MTKLIKKTLLNRKFQLKKFILNEHGKPDKLAIELYWEFYSFYIPKRIKKDGIIFFMPKLHSVGIFSDYAKLAKKFKCHKDTIRRKFDKLEELGLLHRSYHHKHYVTNNSYNKLIIYIWRNNPLFESQYGSYSKDVTLCPPTLHKHLKQEHNIIFGKHAPSDVTIKDEISFDINVNKKNQLVNNKDKNYDENADTKLHKNKLITKVIRFKKSIFNKDLFKRNLAKMYPLSEKDCEKLRKTSGRSFTSNAMNEILLNMSKRIPAIFSSRRGFMSYMNKVFVYEKRDAVKTAYTNFRIFNNRSDEEVTILKQEKLLSELEYNLNISPEWQFKKKLAAVLTRNTAYALITSYDSIEIKNNVFNFKLSKHVNLTESEKNIILSQAQATYLDIVDLNILMQEKQRVSTNNSHKKIEIIFPDGVWGSIRKTICPQIDFSWISKLEAHIDEDNKQITLKAPSEFYKDWIESNYLNAIVSTASRLFGFSVNF